MDKYIKRRAIIEKLNEIGGCDATDDWGKGWDKAIDTAVKAAEKLPAANVAPVKHGHWYNRGGRFHCSVCNNKALLKDIGGTGGWSHEYEQQKSPYCPNCGAIMNGGNENAR